MRALEELLIDVDELDRDLVATVLAPYVRIDRRSCGIVPLSAWDRSSTETRVMLYLVARRAMRALGLPVERDAALPIEIARATGIPGGSVRPALQRLLKARVVAREGAMGYIVPNYAMARVREYLRPAAGLVA